MKKLTILIVLAIFLISCSDTGYKTGVYSGTYDHYDGHGWLPHLSIIIEKSKIVKAEYNYTNSKNEIKTDSKYYADVMKKVSGITPAEAAVELEKRLIEKQEPPVDVVTGASHSTKNFNELSNAVLKKAGKGDTSKTILPMNNVYHVEETEFGADGWKGNLSLEYQFGKIVEFEYDEVNEDGTSMFRINSDFNKVITAYRKELLESQDIDAVISNFAQDEYGEKVNSMLKQAYNIRMGK